MEAETPRPHFIPHEEVDMATTPDQPVDNTRAKQRTLTITQEYVLVATVHITPYNNNPNRLLCEYAKSILDEKIGELLEYKHLIKHPKYKETLSHSYRNEIGRLVQGMLGRANDTDTMFFINKTELPQE